MFSIVEVLIKLSYLEMSNIILQNGCELLSSEIKNQSSDIHIKCSCGRTFITTFERFNRIGKRKCDVCTGRHYDITFVREYISRFGDELMTGEYINLSQNLSIKCKCGNLYTTTFLKFMRRGKTACNICTIGRESGSLTEDEVNKYLESKGLELMSPYHSSSEKVKVRCSCGNEFERSFNKIKSSNQSRCKHCTISSSKIEVLAEDYLKSRNISYKTQYIYKELKVRHNVFLRFDIAIIGKNSDVIALIELDGEQHYLPVKAWGGEEALLKRQKYDEEKNSFCISHNIPLYRIPYWKFNKINEEVENILNMTILCQAS
jgi:hypothetical protein